MDDLAPPSLAPQAAPTAQPTRSLLHQLAADRASHQGRLLAISTIALGIGGAISAIAVAQFIHPDPMVWAPYTLGPFASLSVWWLDRAGHRNAAVIVLAFAAAILSGQAGIQDPTSVSSALYLLPTSMFVMSFIESTIARRSILAVMLVLALLQRGIRLAAGLDVSMDAWVEGTFHSVAIFSLFAVLMEFLHQRHATHRRELENAFEAVSRARLAADAEATAALDGSRNTSSFLETMSHELRTPLNAVVGYAELLIDDEPGDPHEQDLQRICGAGMHMAELVDDVLDVSKVESGRLQRNLSRVDVRSTLSAVADLARPLLRPGVDLLVQVDDTVDTVITDNQKLRQILLNLLSNAARFTPRGSVTLRARTADGELVLAVDDTGIGMDPEEADGMFEAFAQADHSHGTGLGLALCVRFAELLGGRIEVATELGEGSTFTLRVPVGPEALYDDDHRASEDAPAVPRSQRDDQVTATRRLEIGTISTALFGAVTAGLVLTGQLPSYLGTWPFLGLIAACGVSLGLARLGRPYVALGLYGAAAILVDAHSHVLHPHAQASVLYLCVLAVFASLVLPARATPATLVGGGVAVLGMLGLRATQGLDAADQLVSMALDTTLVYTVTAILLGMWVARHRSEELALAAATFDLDRLRAQAAALARAANAANQAKASFVAAMSHELRSPLNAILGYAALLEEEWPSDDPGREDIHSIQSAGRALLALVDEVLDLSRVRAGGLPLEPEAIDLAHLAASHGLGLDGHGVVWADRYAVDRLLGLLAERRAQTLQVHLDTLTVRLPCNDVRGDPLEPLSFDPCLGRPGAGWALAHALCRSIGGVLSLRVTDSDLLVSIRLPTAGNGDTMPSAPPPAR